MHAQARKQRPGSVRMRVLGLMLAFMTIGLVAAGTVSHSVQLQDLSDRANAELEQEVSELRQLAAVGVDNQPFTSVDALLSAYLSSNVPSQDEATMALVDGEVRLLSADAPFDLNQPDVVRFARDRRVPGRATMGELTVESRTLRVAVVAVDLPQDPQPGTLVVAADLTTRRSQVYASLRAYAVVTVLTVVLSGLIGFAVAGRLLRPLQQLRQATQRISTDDLTSRVPVTDADTDVSALAATFNTMLDRLEEGFRSQRRFLDDAAHELRTPLTILRGNIELMRSGDADDVEQTRDLVLDELDRMQRLVDDLLLLARSQRPDFIVPDIIELPVFLDETMERLQLLGDRHWRLQADTAGTMTADRQRVLQALIQLGANAVKFSVPGAEVTLGAHRTPGRVHLWVRDTGIGIDPADQHRIFDRFARLEQQPGVEGFGLGLSIVAAIADGHGGEVEVTSAPGEGSTIGIWLPDHAPAERG